MISALDTILNEIKPLDNNAMAAARKRQDSLTKPHGSLGVMEDLSVKIAGIKADPSPRIQQKAIITMAADHGVVNEGVALYPQDVPPFSDRVDPSTTARDQMVRIGSPSPRSHPR